MQLGILFGELILSMGIKYMLHALFLIIIYKTKFDVYKWGYGKILR